MKVSILGGGLAGISLAYFLQDSPQVESIEIFEKEERIGGLCRSIEKDGYIYDIGPHILFSKDKEMLQLMLDVLPEKNDLKRSNQILHKGRLVQYPFENDLSKLPKDDLDYCVKSFLTNPYREYKPENMLQFFLKTFGEGITNTYLRPYNEKIWKYDPSFMDTQMVERIPQPTDEEILRSAAGETVEGYVHQLYFHYPKNGGIEAVVQGFARKLNSKCHIHVRAAVESVARDGEAFIFKAGGKEYRTDGLISTIPIQVLADIYEGAPKNIMANVADLKYNSILIAFVKTKEDLSGDNFAFMIADKDVIFHRISKMDFLGEAYQSDGATYMIEVTYRQGDYTDSLSEEVLKKLIADGLMKVGFAREQTEIDFIDISRYPYAYVIYDLHHKANMEAVRQYFGGEGVHLHGRFGNFEYWNMDRVLRESKKLAESLVNKEQG